MVVTFTRGKQECVSEYDISNTDKIKELLHNGDIYKQYAEYFHKETKNQVVCDNTLGWILSTMPKFYSRIRNINFHTHRNFNALKRTS